MRPAVCPGKRHGRAGRLFLFNRGNELVARMSVVVCLGKRDGIASRLFFLHSGKELVAKINHVVCHGKRGGIATGLFHLDRGNEFVAGMSLAVSPRKRGGRASSPFRINGNLGILRSFRPSLAIAALHSHTILTQRVQTALSTAPHNHLLVRRIKMRVTPSEGRVLLLVRARLSPCCNAPRNAPLSFRAERPGLFLRTFFVCRFTLRHEGSRREKSLRLLVFSVVRGSF